MVLSLTYPVLAQITPPEGVPPPEGYSTEAQAIGGLFSYDIVGFQRITDEQPVINPLGVFRFNDSPPIQIAEGGHKVTNVESLGQRWVTKQLEDGSTEVVAVFIHKYTVEIEITVETVVQPQDFPVIADQKEIELYELRLYKPRAGLFGLPDVYNYVLAETQRRSFTVPQKTPQRDFDQTFLPSTKGDAMIRLSVNPSFSFPAVLNTSGDFYYQYDRFWVGVTDIRSNGWTNGTISDQTIVIDPAVLSQDQDTEEFIGGGVDYRDRAHYYGTLETTTASIEQSYGFIAGGSPVGRPADLFLDEVRNERGVNSPFYDSSLMDGVNQLSVNAFVDFHIRPRATLYSVTHRWDHLIEIYVQNYDVSQGAIGSFIPFSHIPTPDMTERVIVGNTIDNAFVHNFYNVTVYLATYYDLVSEETGQDPFIWNENDFADDPYEFYENNVFNPRAWGAKEGAEYINDLENQLLNTIILIIIIVVVAIVIIAVAGMGVWFGGRYLKKRNIVRRGETVEDPKQIRVTKKSRMTLYLGLAVTGVIVIAIIALAVYLIFFNPLFLYLGNPIFAP